MQRPVLNPGTVLWSGENSYVKLREKADGPDLARIGLFRIVYSPKGLGHAAFVCIDFEGDGLGGDDLCAIFTDNPELAGWIHAEVMQNPFWKEKNLPIVAARFGFSGDSSSSWTERIEAEGQTVEIRWSKLDRPYMYEAPCGRVSKKFDLFCILISAWQVEVTVNGRKAPGKTFSMELDGRTISDSCLSLSETWVVPKK